MLLLVMVRMRRVLVRLRRRLIRLLKGRHYLWIILRLRLWLLAIIVLPRLGLGPPPPPRGRTAEAARCHPLLLTGAVLQLQRPAVGAQRRAFLLRRRRGVQHRRDRRRRRPVGLVHLPHVLRLHRHDLLLVLHHQLDPRGTVRVVLGGGLQGGPLGRISQHHTAPAAAAAVRVGRIRLLPLLVRMRLTAMMIMMSSVGRIPTVRRVLPRSCCSSLGSSWLSKQDVKMCCLHRCGWFCCFHAGGFSGFLFGAKLLILQRTEGRSP